MTSEIVSYYRVCGSIKECARKFGISPQKVRRVLLNAGEYSSPLSDKIADLHEHGMSPSEIAEYLHMRLKTVNGYLPYSKGVYNNETPTANAQRIRAFRERKSKGA